MEARRKLVTVEGAKTNYGVILNPVTLELDEIATEILRSNAETAEAGKPLDLYDRGGNMADLVRTCKEETGFEPPAPQWEEEVYGPHVALPYVKDWYAKGREIGYKMWDV